MFLSHSLCPAPFKTSNSGLGVYLQVFLLEKKLSIGSCIYFCKSTLKVLDNI